ncbi:MULTISPECIES: hypothetical protein [unclassified Spiroplasma]|uniref:hypothetical protein n=1 Tax=unclassified Spiroplasma TaxID=2637901 RepID=UPI00313C3095
MNIEIIYSKWLFFLFLKIPKKTKRDLKDLKTLQELVDDINHKDKAIISDEENEIVNLKKDIDVQKDVLDHLKEKLNDLITIKGDANV